MRGKEKQNRKDKYNGKETKGGGLVNQYEEEEEKGKTEMIK